MAALNPIPRTLRLCGSQIKTGCDYSTLFAHIREIIDMNLTSSIPSLHQVNQTRYAANKQLNKLLKEVGDIWYQYLEWHAKEWEEWQNILAVTIVDKILAVEASCEL